MTLDEYTRATTKRRFRIQPASVPTDLDVFVIRKKAGYGATQRAFAAAIGVTTRAVQNWEQGKRKPSGPARVLLAIVDRHPGLISETLAPPVTSSEPANSSGGRQHLQHGTDADKPRTLLDAPLTTRIDLILEAGPVPEGDRKLDAFARMQLGTAR
jgi:putative transcriptional regulator